MFFPAVLINIPNSKVYLKGEWCITPLLVGRGRAIHMLRSALWGGGGGGEGGFLVKVRLPLKYLPPLMGGTAGTAV